MKRPSPFAVLWIVFVALGMIQGLVLPKPSLSFHIRLLTLVAIPWALMVVYAINFLMTRKSGELPSEHPIGDIIDGRFGDGAYRRLYPIGELIAASNIAAFGLTLLWHPTGPVSDGVTRSAVLSASFGVAVLTWCAVARLLNLYSTSEP